MTSHKVTPAGRGSFRPEPLLHGRYSYFNKGCSRYLRSDNNPRPVRHPRHRRFRCRTLPAHL